VSSISPSATSETNSFTVSVDQISEAEWNRSLQGFADANIYQTWAYGAVSWGESQLSHLVLKRGAETVALAQLRVIRLPIIGRGIAYLRWGPVCQAVNGKFDESIFCAVMSALVKEYARRRRLLLRVIPQVFQQEAPSSAVASALRGFEFTADADVAAYRTSRVDLSPAPELIRKRLDQKWRNQLNGAERNDLHIAEGTSEELYHEFLALYHEMMARKQFETTVDVNEFLRIQQRLPENQKMLIMISRKAGVPMTGLVASTVGATGIYLLGATSNEGMKSKGSYLLQWTMMQRLKERGCLWYDLGGINPEGNPGVYHFKQGMGGEEVQGLGRYSVAKDILSAVSVKSAERAKSLGVILRKRWSRRSSPETAPQVSR